MRLAMLCILLSPVLCAMDAQGVRFARRTLLDESARKHLRAEVGDVAPLAGCTVLQGDFNGDGKPDQAALVWRDRACALGLFEEGAEAPSAVRLWTPDQTPTAATLNVAARDCVRLETSSSGNSGPRSVETVHWLILRWHDGAWCEALDIVRSQTTTSGGGRLRSVLTREIATENGTTQLVETATDLLDGKLLEGSATRRTSTLTATAEGKLTVAPPQGNTVPVATRAQMARTLEREGLLAPALEQVGIAIAQAQQEGVQANDARLLDARSLQMRLQARLPGPVVGTK